MNLHFQERRQTEFIQAIKPCKRGHIGLRYANHGACVECTQIRSVINNEKNKGKPDHLVLRAQWRRKNEAYLREWSKDYISRNPKRKLIFTARASAKKKGLPFNLELSDIVIPAHCPVLGIELQRGVRGRNDNSPSIDRIIPALGYVRGNILIISWRANRIKNDASIEELAKIAAFYGGLHERLG